MSDLTEKAQELLLHAEGIDLPADDEHFALIEGAKVLTLLSLAEGVEAVLAEVRRIADAAQHGDERAAAYAAGFFSERVAAPAVGDPIGYVIVDREGDSHSGVLPLDEAKGLLPTIEAEPLVPDWGPYRIAGVYDLPEEVLHA